MKKIFTLSVICLFAVNTFAQEENELIRCGNSVYNEFLQAKYPDFTEKKNAIFQKAATAQLEYKSSDVVYTIPVVVHVVYKNSMENISNVQIQSQLDVLNLDFRKMNSDASEVPSLFANLAADAELEFCLATVDPDGNPSTGITHTLTNVEVFTTNDSIKQDATGGKSAWDTNRYLNIWVGALSGSGNQLLGYATGPGGTAWRDGVVVRYDAFGTMGAASFPYNKGRTCTHEVGHYLGLSHIWGDNPDCMLDDGIDDTPLQADETTGCPTFGSPSTISCGSQDMFMNYMDYTYDACMYMFTEGQVAFMRNVLETERAGLLQSVSVACDPTGGDGCRDLEEESLMMGFEDIEDFSYWSILNNNGDSKQWQISEGVAPDWGPRTGDKCMAYTWSYSASADDWFFTPCFEMEEARDYKLHFWYATGSEPGFTYPEKLKVAFSTSPSPDDIFGENDFGEIVQPYNPNIPDNNYKKATIELPDYEGSEIYIGFQCYSDADQYALLIDDIDIDIVVSTKNVIASEAFQIYPNPVSDQLRMDFNFDKTIENLHLNLVDLTGKITHRETLKNYAAGNLQLDMSKYPSGVYFLNIQADEQMTTQKVVVYK